MSQAGKIIIRSPIPGEVITLTGNSGGAVGPDGGGNINVVGDGTTVTVAGNPGTNTLTISAFGRVATAQTVDGSTITLDTIPVVNNSVSLINCQVIGAYPAADVAAIGGDFSVLAINNAGTVSLANNAVVPIVEIQSPLTTSSITLDANGSNVRIRVTGEGTPNTNVNWKSTTTILNQATP